MEAILNRSKKCLIVRLKGELDDHAAPKIRQNLKDMLDKYPDFSLLLNLKDLSFIDSSGVGVILGRYRDMAQEEREILLCCLNSQVRRVLDLAGVLKIIPAFGSEKEALNQGRFAQ